MNTIGSKVVIRPLAETLELSVKMDLLLQRTMVHPTDLASSSQDFSADLPSGEIPESSDAIATGDLPSGEIPEASEANATGDLPSGQMLEAKEEAEGLEDLPLGKRSRTEAKEEEDVEMQECEEQQEEEFPQDTPMGAPDYGADEAGHSDSESLNSTIMARANELVSSQIYKFIADEEKLRGEPSNFEQRPRMATRQMAKFLNQFLRSDRGMIDGCLQKEMPEQNELMDNWNRCHSGS